MNGLEALQRYGQSPWLDYIRRGLNLEVLAERGRRALRVHLGADTRAGLEVLRVAVGAALG